MEQKDNVTFFPPVPELRTDTGRALRPHEAAPCAVCGNTDTTVYQMPGGEKALCKVHTPQAGVNIPAQPARLVISGELLPQHEIVHHMLMSLFDEKEPPKVNVEFTNRGSVLRYTLTFSSDKDILGTAAAETRARKMAEDGRITIEAARERVAEQMKGEAEAEKRRKDEEAKTNKEPARVTVQTERTDRPTSLPANAE